MFDIFFLLKLLNREKVFQYLDRIMLFSFLILLDMYVTILIGNYLTDYFILSFLCIFCLLGLFFMKRFFSVFFNSLRQKKGTEKIPIEDFYFFTGYFLSSILLLVPGLISGLLGLTILFPGFTKTTGKILSKSLGINWNKVYEYYSINR